MAAPMQCVCHILEVDKNEPLLDFTDVSWGKLCDSVTKWSLLDGQEKVISDNFDFNGRNGASYHRRCYQKFTDKRRIEQGQIRKEKGKLKKINVVVDSVHETVDEPVCKKIKPTLRSDFNETISSSTCTVSERRSKHVLPHECIICRKSKCCVSKFDRKRKIEKLITCETTSDKLLEAAKLKNDERILLQVGPYDPVSIEVRYHASCYKQYTRCVYNYTDKEKDSTVRPLTKSFEVFSRDIIENRIISKGEVMKMSVLNKHFISIVKDIEDIDITNYRHYQLKSRIQKKFPMLEFIQPGPHVCELVYYNEDNSMQILNISRDSDTDSDSDTASNDSNISYTPSSQHYHHHDQLAELYRAAMVVRSAIVSMPGLSCWPPKSGDFSVEECMNTVPTELFNFLAWCCDASSDFSTDKICLDLHTQKKVLSLSQDIITFASHGRKLMPKHVALGMTIRHLTGSSRLQSLLNGFGHCVSHSFTLELSVINASIKQDRYIFSRMLILAEEKKLDLKDVLKYPLTSVPASLAAANGSLVKTTKSTLLHELESKVDDSSCTTGHDSVLIVDGMALIQQHQKFVGTFGQYAVSVLQIIISLALRYHAFRVDFVGDRYLPDSIKQLERRDRAQTGETRIHIRCSEQKMPKQMKKYLACGDNKEELLSFIVNEWKNCPADMFCGVCLYVTDGARCDRLSVSDNTVITEEIRELYTDQEEADTRIFLHVINASSTSPPTTSIVIRSADTDVFVLSLWASTLVENRLMLLMSSPGNSRIIDVDKIKNAVGQDVANAIVGLHPFTGCDTVSAFKSKGKIKALKLMLSNPQYIQTFQQLGQDWTVSENLLQELEQFVCELYGWRDCLEVNEVRYNCFRFGCIGDASLPPNKDSLLLHSQRANYQACIYRKSIEQQVTAPSPDGHGWRRVGSQLCVKWSNMDIAPACILQNIFCKCKKSTCCSTKCTCRKSNISCTTLCHCLNCTNCSVINEDNTCSDPDDTIDSDDE